MDSTEEKKIQKNYCALLEAEAESLLPHLIQEGLINFDDKERVSAQTTTKDKMEMLLSLISKKKKKKAYKIFRQSLIQDHDFLVDQLDNTKLDSSDSEDDLGKLIN